MKTRADIAARKERNKRIAKYVAIRLGLLLVLLIPTYIAIASYTAQKNAPVEDKLPVYDSMKLTGPSGATFETTEEDETLLSAFLPLFVNAETVQDVPNSHRNGAYTAVMTSGKVNEVYTFYFSPYFSTCYYKTEQDEVFLISDGEKTDGFLNSAFAFELYADAKVPTLSSAVTDAVAPSQVSWHYRTKNGSFTQLLQTAAVGETRTYPIAASDVVLRFSADPDSHEVIIKHGDAVLYRGKVSDISLSFDEPVDFLDFEVNAIYNENASRNFYGTLTYRFRMEVVEAADFVPSRLAATTGGYFIVRCENVNNTDKLNVTTTPADVTPVVFKRDQYVFVAIPADRTGEYTLQFTYGTTTKSFVFSASAANSAQHTPNTEALGTDYTTLVSTTLPQLIESKGANVAGSIISDPTRIPNGSFSAVAAERIFAFGDTLLPSGAASATSPLCFDLYRMDGAVKALSAGTVLEVGERADLGKYVIVDHGCGLYTWYAGLGELRTHTGAILRAGDTVGLASTKLYTESCALIMATLGKSVLSTEYLSANGFVWNEPVTG